MLLSLFFTCFCACVLFLCFNCFCFPDVSVFELVCFSIACQVFLNRVVVTVLADLQLCFIWFVFQSLRLLLVRAVTLWHRHFGTVGTDTLAQ